jgi:hypothetical protein
MSAMKGSTTADLVLATKLPGAGVIAAALIGALLVIGALVLLMRRRPEAFPLLAVFALPFRLPIAAAAITPAAGSLLASARPVVVDPPIALISQPG